MLLLATLTQAQTVSLVYRFKGLDYLLNLIDTPGDSAIVSSCLAKQCAAQRTLTALLAFNV
jgi:translation elongation factor EF-4